MLPCRIKLISHCATICGLRGHFVDTNAPDFYINGKSRNRRVSNPLARKSRIQQFREVSASDFHVRTDIAIHIPTVKHRREITLSIPSLRWPNVRGVGARWEGKAAKLL